MKNVNKTYAELLDSVIKEGDWIKGRNGLTVSHTGGLQVKFDSFPIVTARKTAWKKALFEMEWFMSGEERCPEGLKDWWAGQLQDDTFYYDGYPKQFRKSACSKTDSFDQIAHIFNELNNNPLSRRIILTTWNPGDMAHITQTNHNPNTPTCCHNTATQFFVRDGKLNMHTFQRSCDLLLGGPHNWVQNWAMLVYFAYYTDFEVGQLVWTYGDAHIYGDISHIDTAFDIIAASEKKLFEVPEKANLVYSPEKTKVKSPQIPVFKADDFYIDKHLKDPVTTGKPKLL